RDLRSGSELQFVPRHPRAGDLADDGRVDTEVLERLDEGGGCSLGNVAGHLARRRGAAENAAVGKLVLLVRLDRADVEEARLIGILRGQRLDQKWRRLRVPDDGGKVVHDVA